MIRLNSVGGWCGNQQAAHQNWITVDLKAPTVLRGFRMRPVQRFDGTIAYASVLRLQVSAVWTITENMTVTDYPL